MSSTARRRRSRRTRSPTAPTCTRSSARTRPTPSRSSPTTCPLQGPAGGPNFYEFGDDVLYEIHIDNDNDGRRRHHVPVPVHDRRSRSAGRSSTTSARSTSLDSANWNRRQFYSVTRIDWGHRTLGGTDGARCCNQQRLASHVPCPPCNIGPRSTPNYAALASAAMRRSAGGGARCSRASAPKASTSTSARSSTSARCGRSRACTSIPIPGSAAAVNATKDLNVHSIALQIPKTS